MSKLTLKQEAKIIKLQNKLQKLEDKGSLMSGSEYIQQLLPNYDQKTNHEGKLIEWHNANQIEKGLKGGVRSGKTFTLEAEAIKLSFINRPEYHFSLSPSFDNACETVVENLQFLCKQDDLAFDWVKSNNLFLIHWGSKEEDSARILIHGMDSNWLGLTAASGDLNEPFSIKKTAFKNWVDRISSPRAKLLRRFWGGTAIPETMQWGFEYFDEEKIVTPDLYADTISTYGNKYLSPAYIESLEKLYTGKEREVRMLGKCIRLVEGEAVYYAHDQEKDRKIFNMAEPGEFAISFDFNINPMTAAMAMLKPGRVHFNEDFKLSKSSTPELCDLVINRLRDKKYIRPDGYSIHGSSFIITGDASGEHGDTRSHVTDYLIIQEKFQKAGIKIQPVVPKSNPSVRDSAAEVNAALETEVMKLDPGCKDLLRTLDMTAWKPGGMGFTIDEQAEWGHHSACMRYLLWNTMVLWKVFEGQQTSDVTIIHRTPRR